MGRSGFSWTPSGRQGKDERQRRSPPHLASRDLAPALLRGSAPEIRAPGLGLRLITRETPPWSGLQLPVAVGTSTGPGPAHDSRYQDGAAPWTIAFGL